MSDSIIKYPSTSHLMGSRLQKGDNRQMVALNELPAGTTCVVEEKLDGANSAFSFSNEADGLLQSRGHFLSPDRSVFRERHFNHLKTWFSYHEDVLFDRFGERYVVYGEWLGVTHSVFYDRLPHLFMEFDILDKRTGQFLDTATRYRLCEGMPFASVPVLFEGQLQSEAQLLGLVKRSLFQSEGWEDGLSKACALVQDDFEARLAKMDRSGLAEGLYIKAEHDGTVMGRYKFVRETFTQLIVDADEHWQSRFPVPNLLDEVVLPFPDYLRAPRPLAAISAQERTP